MHYRYEKAVLSGSRFAVWLARTLGVKATVFKANLTPEEAERLGIKPDTSLIDLPPGLQNGDEES
jgi:hypothetical protein